MYLFEPKTDKGRTDSSPAYDKETGDIKVEAEIAMEHEASNKDGSTEDESNEIFILHKVSLNFRELRVEALVAVLI